MKNKFWTIVISIVITVIEVLFIWFIFDKPIITDNATQMVACLAIIALYNNSRDYISREEELLIYNAGKEPQ